MVPAFDMIHSVSVSQKTSASCADFSKSQVVTSAGEILRRFRFEEALERTQWQAWILDYRLGAHCRGAPFVAQRAPNLLQGTDFHILRDGSRNVLHCRLRAKRYFGVSLRVNGGQVPSLQGRSQSFIMGGAHHQKGHFFEEFVLPKGHFSRNFI